MSIQDFLNLDHKPFVISTDDHPLNQFKVINSKNLVQTGESASTVMDENMLYVEEYFCVTCGTRNSSMWRRDDCGQCLCNACKLYKMRNGINRPSRLHNREMQKRTRVRQPDRN